MQIFGRGGLSGPGGPFDLGGPCGSGGIGVPGGPGGSGDLHGLVRLEKVRRVI